jgi:hypothetical protein
MHSMARLLAWLNKYGDSALALFLALGVGILTLADIVGPNDVSGAILLTLGLVATSSLRNRAREEAMDTEIHDVLRSTAEMLTKLPARLNELESTVEGTRRALTESSFIRVLHGAEVGVALEEARRNTDRWVCWYQLRFSFVIIELGLSAVMSTFRWDMTPHRLIITQEDPQFPAMMLEPGKYYYEIYSRELMASLRQCRPVPISRLDHIDLSDEPSVDETRKLFADIDLPLPRTFTDRNVAEIVSKAIQAKNPYR